MGHGFEFKFPLWSGFALHRLLENGMGPLPHLAVPYAGYARHLQRSRRASDRQSVIEPKVLKHLAGLRGRSLFFLALLTGCQSPSLSPPLTRFEFTSPHMGTLFSIKL